jgi:hypothetical protein
LFAKYHAFTCCKNPHNSETRNITHHAITGVDFLVENEEKEINFNTLL